MAASREKVLYFEPQPSEQTAALKTVLVRMGVRIKNVEAVSAGQTVGFLLNRKEIAKIARALEGAGRTLIPLSLYFKDGYAKVEIAVATGKKDWDKRRDIADRDAKREAERAMRTRNRLGE